MAANLISLPLSPGRTFRCSISHLIDCVSRFVLVQDATQSWVAKFNRLRGVVAGMYAIEVGPQDERKERNRATRKQQNESDEEALDEEAMNDDDDE